MRTISRARDAEGNIYYKLSYVEELTKGFDEYLDKASLTVDGVFERTGEEGFTCVRFDTEQVNLREEVH